MAFVFGMSRDCRIAENHRESSSMYAKIREQRRWFWSDRDTSSMVEYVTVAAIKESDAAPWQSLESCLSAI